LPATQLIYHLTLALQVDAALQQVYRYELSQRGREKMEYIAGAGKESSETKREQNEKILYLPKLNYENREHETGREE